jgi:GH25 family lysozyme M1 (1,4-beta-N-acetylmuramidase)
MPRIDLIDLSSNNGHVDFPTVRAAGVQAMIHKATEGVGSLDSQCLTRCAQAKAAGLKVGVYHYLRVRHGRAQDAAEQASEYLAVWKQVSPDLLPCVDVESMYNTVNASAGAATAAECQEAVMQFVQAIVAATNLAPIIYTSNGEWTSMGLTGLPVGSSPLWEAGYGSSATPPSPWTSKAAWQFSGSGQCPGVTGACDLTQCDNLAALLVPSKNIALLGLLAGLSLIAALAYYVASK